MLINSYGEGLGDEFSKNFQSIVSYGWGNGGVNFNDVGDGDGSGSGWGDGYGTGDGYGIGDGSNEIKDLFFII